MNNENSIRTLWVEDSPTDVLFLLEEVSRVQGLNLAATRAERFADALLTNLFGNAAKFPGHRDPARIEFGRLGREGSQLATTKHKIVRSEAAMDTVHGPGQLLLAKTQVNSPDMLRRC